VLGPGGQPLVRAGVSSIAYTVYQLDEQDPNLETPVAGHTARPLVVADVIYDSLQLGSLWDVDAVGYNFKHTLDVSSQQAFGAAGLFYRVRYELAIPAGQPVLVRFKVRVI
jgi:hypothetical protein